VSLRAIGLRKRFDGPWVLDGISFTLEGGILALSGPNGSGKSTILRLVSGVLAADGGSVVLGDDLLPSRRALARLGYVPEGADPPDHLTVRELLALVAALKRVPVPPASSAAMDAALLLDQRIGSLSLGQRRRACLAAAMVGDPWLLVLDEPENGLDAAGVAALVDLLRAHVARGGAVLLSSHDAAFLEALEATRFFLTPATGGIVAGG
jgi:ABC-type multidrug transport system ATPase subunit